MISSTITIPQTLEKVWGDLMNKDALKEWYFDIPDFEAKEGSVFTFYEPGENRSYLHRCEVLKIVPFQEFKHTWTHPNHSKGESVVRWSLQSAGANSTIVKLTHQGIENFEDAGKEFREESYQAGWDFLLMALKLYTNGLRRRKYSIAIKADAVKIWKIIWDEKSYREWSKAFSEGSFYQGELKTGSRFYFLNKDNSGVYSDLMHYEVNSTAVFQHIGLLKDGKEQAIDEEVEKWSGSFEIYTLKPKEGYCILDVELDQDESNFESFDEVFPKALQYLKDMAETTSGK